MKINIPFLVVSYIIGMFVDWVFQWDWQATNKSKWSKGDNKFTSLNAVLSHSFVYAVLTTFITCFVVFGNMFQSPNEELIFLVLFITHLIIDTRIPVKAILKFKGMSDKQICDYQNFGFMHIGIDQRLHEITLLILSMVI